MTIHNMDALRPDTATLFDAKSVVLLDNDRSALRRLSELLRAEGFSVEVFSDANAAQNSMRRKRPDIAVFKAKLPRVGGIELLQKLRSQEDTLPVMLMNESSNPVDEEVALRLGADDYLRKSTEPRVIVERIKAMLRRIYWVAEPQKQKRNAERIQAGPLLMDGQRHSVTWRGHPVALTATEFTIVSALARHPGHVKSRDQVMDEVYGDNVYVDDRTIDSHIKRIRGKMRRVDPKFTAIETLYGIGYRLNLPAE